MLLRILQDVVVLVLATAGIGGGVLTAFGDVKPLRPPVVRLVASVVLVAAGLWVFYVGIRHIVSG